jgi:hypothetical protein
MRDTRLIFVEGIPGSGKSTAAQFLTHQMERQGIPAVWWYEETRSHPLFVFHNLPSLNETVDKLFSGRHGEVVDAALARWRKFAEQRAHRHEVTVFDSCLFGYMTWGLFPADVAPAEITAYVTEVERIIAPLGPLVVYLYQDDVGAALRKVVQRRGGDTEAGFIRRTSDSPYGKRQGLEGFDGAVRYWTDFRALADRLFDRCPFAKLAIENSAGDWPAYEARMLEFLQLSRAPDDLPRAEDPSRFVGAYRPAGSATGPECRISLEGGCLWLDGVDIVWRNTRLLPRGSARFAVQSLPFAVTFGEGSTGDVVGLHLTGPDMLQGAVDRRYARRAAR